MSEEAEHATDHIVTVAVTPRLLSDVLVTGLRRPGLTVEQIQPPAAGRAARIAIVSPEHEDQVRATHLVILFPSGRCTIRSGPAARRVSITSMTKLRTVVAGLLSS